jgi:hypothetical protein
MFLQFDEPRGGNGAGFGCTGECMSDIVDGKGVLG